MAKCPRCHSDLSETADSFYCSKCGYREYKPTRRERGPKGGEEEKGPSRWDRLKVTFEDYLVKGRKVPLWQMVAAWLICAVFMFLTLFYFFGSAFQRFIVAPIKTQVPRLAPLVYVAIFGGFLLLSFFYVSRGFTVGVGLSILTIIMIGAIIPNAPSMFAWALGGGELERLVGKWDLGCVFGNFLSPGGWTHCWTPVEEEAPPYVGTKTHELLKIRLGDERPPESGKYKVPTAYAYPPDAVEFEQYELPFYIENLDEEDEEGITLEAVDVNRVYAYKYRKRPEDDPLIRFQNVDICSSTMSEKGDTCNLKPGEKTKIYASNFAEFGNRIPCEEENLNKLEFELEVTYTQVVTHRRIFILAKSPEDEQLIYEDPTLKQSLVIREPSDGPIDLIIDFNQNPYTMEDRPGNKIRMSVWIANEKVKGKYEPKSLVVESVGGLPDWLVIDKEAAGGKCSMGSGENGKFLLFDLKPGFTDDEAKEYKCPLRIGSYPDESKYKLLSFTGELEYTYNYNETFTSTRYLASVDTDECPPEETTTTTIVGETTTTTEGPVD